MKAITLHEPWATLIASGRKRIENRTWEPNPFRIGKDLAIHAAKRVPMTRDHAGIAPDGEAWPDLEGLPLGCVVAVVRLVRVVPPSLDISDEYPFAESHAFKWELDRVRRLREPVQCKGFQKIWRLPADVEEKVRGQIV